MGLFKRNQEQGQAQQVNLSQSKAIPVRHQLRRLLGKKQDATNNPDLGSRPPSYHGDSLATLSLWDRAYDSLRKSEPKLVEDYEDLLSKDAQETSSASNDGPAQAMLLEDMQRGTDGQSQQARLKTIIAVGLERIEEKKTRYTIAGHEFNLSSQIDQAARLVLWAKDWIGEAVKQSPEASIAWAGVCIILPLLTNPRVADEANSNGFVYVTTRMRYYTELEPLLQRLGRNPQVSSALMAEANNHIVQLYEYILEFQIRSVLRFYQSHLRRYVSDVILIEDWNKMVFNIKEFEGTVDRTLTQMNQFVARNELEALSNKSTETLAIMQQLLLVSEKQIRIATDQLEIAQRGLEIQQDEVKQKLSAKQNECLQLFRLTDGKKDATYEWYKDRVEARVQGTCEWFLKHENFQRWLEQNSGPLLVSADPGCGKSVLAKYLIEEGLPRSSTICYFFFKDQDQNTTRQALCALLHQLFSQKPFLIEHAMSQFNVDGRGLINSTHSLWTVLENTVQDPQAGYIIIVLDALDECLELEYEDLVRNIENQFRGNRLNPGKLKYLLTSRPYEQIVSKFQRLLDTFPYVRIPGEEESETISQEVNQVIEYRVETLAKEKGLSDQVKDHLAERLLKIPHRTYLWVYLVFDYLEKEHFKKTTKGIDSTIATLPKNVYQAYEKILSKSKEEDPTVRKALSIILVASRPLTIAEMNVALNVDTTSKSIYDLDLEENEDFKSRLRSLCGLFVSIHHEKVYFLHQTAREFLLAVSPPAPIPPGGRWQYSITTRDAHRVLAATCVIYLDFLNSDETPKNESWGTGQYFNSYTFLNYSVRNWCAHFREARISEDADILPFALRICDLGSRSRTTWFKIYWDDHELCDFPETLTSLSLSSYFGHEVLVRQLLHEKSADLESKDTEYGRTPLLWAAERGHNAIVKLLLENNANFELKDGESGQTPLSLAANKGHTEVVKLLLDRGADCESRDRFNRTPLSRAARIGHTEIIKLLLERGANLEPRDLLGQTPLSLAARNGREEAVRLLLENGADVKSRSTSGETPLLWAVIEDHEEVVRILLENGADAESQSNSGIKALLFAASFGHEAVAKLLLDNGADVEDSCGSSKTPLAWAAEGGYEEVVELLLDYGANAEAQSACGKTALSLATERGHEAVIQLLLERSASLSTPTT
ncbi:hypothetical protein F5Y09DRAFT_312761 [Xylaria sp. FL1042]|nr:hypothetical protein F5Y09DRAFT_312761 [Xylaria sp. FL1042]